MGGDYNRKKKDSGGSVECIVLSPPYENSVNSTKSGIDFSKASLDYEGRKWHKERIESHKKKHDNYAYGQTDGQIGSLKGGESIIDES